MGYDLYAGPLAMCYAGDWNEYDQQEPFDRDELLAAVCRWRDSINQGLPDGGVRWEEGYGRQYYYGRVGLDALGALFLRVACHITGDQLPVTVTSGWRFYEDPIIEKAMTGSVSMPSALIAQMWIPFGRIGMFQCPGPTGEKINVSTTATLRKDLDAINQAFWNADGPTIEGWSYEVPSGEGELDTDSLSRYAFSIFWKALSFAERETQPIVVGH